MFLTRFLLVALIAVTGCADRKLRATTKASAAPCPTFRAASDMSLPGEVKTKAAELAFCRTPDGYGAATAWLHAIQDTTWQGGGAVRVDRLRLLGRLRGSKTATIIAEQQYNDSTEVCGGLYRRYRWYANDEHTPFRDAQVDRGSAVLPVSDARDKIWHLYLCKLAPITAEYDRIWMEVSVAIAGGALLQAGLDYWPSTDASAVVFEDGCDGKRICQGATSDWYRSRPGVIRITVGEP